MTELLVIGAGPAARAAAALATKLGLTPRIIDDTGEPDWPGASLVGLLDGDLLVRTPAGGLSAADIRPTVICSRPRSRPITVPGWHHPFVHEADELAELAPPGARWLVAGPAPQVYTAVGDLARTRRHVTAVVVTWRPGPLRSLAAHTVTPVLAFRAAVRQIALRRRHVAILRGRVAAIGAYRSGVRVEVIPSPGRRRTALPVTVDVDRACLHGGLAPAVETAQQFGADVRYSARHGDWMVTSDPPPLSTAAEPGAAEVRTALGSGGTYHHEAQGLDAEIAVLALATRAGVLPASRALPGLARRRLARWRVSMAEACLSGPGSPQAPAPMPDDVIVCPCETRTAADIRAAINDGARDFREIKMFTRAGMGQCLGRRCIPVVCALLTDPNGSGPDTGPGAAALTPPVIRPPLRPVTCGELAGLADNPAPKPATGQNEEGKRR